MVLNTDLNTDLVICGFSLSDWLSICCDALISLSFIWMYSSDGKTVGACLDRNGLRPARYWRTVDNVVYVASEVCLLFILFTGLFEDIRIIGWGTPFMLLRPWKHLIGICGSLINETHC